MKIISKVILMSLIITLLYIPLIRLSSVGWDFDQLKHRKKSYCGKLIHKLDPSMIELHKHSGTLRIEREFIIDFKDLGIKRVEPTVEDFYSFKEGQTVCYKMPVPNDWSGGLFIIMELGLMLWAVVAFAVPVVALTWLIIKAFIE